MTANLSIARNSRISREPVAVVFWDGSQLPLTEACLRMARDAAGIELTGALRHYTYLVWDDGFRSPVFPCWRQWKGTTTLYLNSACGGPILTITLAPEPVTV